jgi:hypothetical protein
LRRRIKLAGVAIVWIVQGACGLTHDRLTFRAKVSDVRNRSSAFVKDKQPDDSVGITLPGKLSNPPASVKLISRAQADSSTTEGAAAAIVSANTAGDISWIVENYIPSDRPAIAKQFSDPAAAQRNTNYYRNVGKISITGWTEIGSYTVLFLQGLEEDGDATLIAIVLSKTANGWKQTNALQNDDTFELVWTALHTGGVR